MGVSMVLSPVLLLTLAQCSRLTPMGFRMQVGRQDEYPQPWGTSDGLVLTPWVNPSSLLSPSSRDYVGVRVWHATDSDRA